MDSSDEGTGLFAMELATVAVLPAVLKSAIELDLLELIKKARNGDESSTFSASYNILSYTAENLPDGGVDRQYSLVTVCKFFTKNDDGASFAPLLLLLEDKIMKETCHVEGRKSRQRATRGWGTTNPYTKGQGFNSPWQHPAGTCRVLEGWGAWPAGLVRGGSSAATCSDPQRPGPPWVGSPGLAGLAGLVGGPLPNNKSALLLLGSGPPTKPAKPAKPGEPTHGGPGRCGSLQVAALDPPLTRPAGHAPQPSSTRHVPAGCCQGELNP
ncbi:hypothetical protein BUALT_Bualt09G0001400 [Buddleja alternifolia]|uniref:Uncharacterized protein n=1 Tax=Buddleja alternifolia TaxID=168488 RepID=A0AAV6X6W5_9LAMI|nr:hypothetical protein BUALT_Bualt09G0001400 [Buddleja alternifolia]